MYEHESKYYQQFVNAVFQQGWISIVHVNTLQWLVRMVSPLKPDLIFNQRISAINKSNFPCIDIS